MWVSGQFFFLTKIKILLDKITWSKLCSKYFFFNLINGILAYRGAPIQWSTGCNNPVPTLVTTKLYTNIISMNNIIYTQFSEDILEFSSVSVDL